jgi:L-ascorbate metabolism protein UlaG (beta-lactamase superfamily)
MTQTITWLGHGSWRMLTGAGTVIYLDPWIKGNPVCPIQLDDIDRADLVCVTHGHSDHLGNAIELVKKTGAVLVTLPEIAAYCERYGIPYDDKGGCLHTGGSINLFDVQIFAVFALHSADIWGEEFTQTGQVTAGSGCCGMIITPDHGKPVYFAGDTGIFGDMALIGKLYQPDVSILPIGGKYTMGVREAGYAMGMLGSPYLIPGHYNTFPGQKADLDELVRQLTQHAPQTRLIILHPGESFELGLEE